MSDRPTSPFARRSVDRRVPEAQAQAREGLLISLLFLLAAAIFVVSGGDRWVAIHLFAAGGLASAFSGVSVMLATTWATAPAPAPGFGHLQRAAVAIGAAGVVIGRHNDLADPVLHAAGGLYVLGLLGLAVILVDTGRNGSKRRFDPAITGWAAALVLAVLGSTAGVALATGTSAVNLRSIHLTTNLLGFIGLAIATTVPYFGSTVVRAKMNPLATPDAVNLTTGLLGAGPLIAVIGLARTNELATAAGLAIHALGVLAIYRISPRPTKRQLEWAGPRMLSLWLGGLWWVIAITATAAEALDGRTPLTGRWLIVLLVGGYAQILWASLAYVLPMIRGGGHEMLTSGFATTRSWITFAGLQLIPVVAIAEAGTVLRVLVAIVLIDTAVRVLRLGVEERRRARDTAASSTPAP